MPIQPLNATGAITDALSRNRKPPTSSGDGSRQNKVPANRIATHTRNMVSWFVPETGIVDMYINPQNIQYKDSKIISDTRTKGGYVMQYWGEEKTVLSISGTTGSSGIEGINVLYDIYRAEQVAFDPFALAFAASLDSAQDSTSLLGNAPQSIGDALGGFASGIGDSFADQVVNSLESGSVNPTRPRPTLASLAFSVEMYWSGWTYRGYFKDFNLTESSQNIGLFDYAMTFIATQKRGFRTNFFPWHRSPTSGPSNSDPTLGTSYSYSDLAPGQTFEPNRQVVERTTSANDRLLSANGYIGDVGINTTGI